MKNKVITVCLGIGLNMFFPEYFTVIEHDKGIIYGRKYGK